MLNIQKIIKDDRLLRAITGLNKKAFDELKETLAQVVPQQEIPRRSQQPRQRAIGAGRKPRLENIEQKLIYILFYFKYYPIFDLAGLLFDIDRSQACSMDAQIAKTIRNSIGRKNGFAKMKTD